MSQEQIENELHEIYEMLSIEAEDLKAKDEWLENLYKGVK